MKTAWVLRLKKDIAKAEYNGQDMFLCDDESIDFLTNDLQRATIIYDKEKQIEDFKRHDKAIIDKFGEDAVRNFGWENISQKFDFVKVGLEERK